MIENSSLVVGFKCMKKSYTIDPINIEQRDVLSLYKHEHKKNGHVSQKG